MGKLKLYVISHTHWDREWYQTFQQYRYRLVRAIDNLIWNLERDPEYQVFHLDGQTIVLEDYLEVRPEMAERLKTLIKAGRIVIGPWYVMPDEFLISGEALIKNLQMGHQICDKYGVKALKNGYVVDIFGHNSQFPQILNGFDIHSAALFRGIADYEKDAFRWQSPDGSEVLTARLDPDRAYSNFYFAVRWPYEENGFDEKDAVKRMKELIERIRGMAACDVALLMDGVDHCGMEPEVPNMLALFKREIPDVEFVHANIEEYFAGLEKAELDLLKGSLYHVGKQGLNNSVLKNVLSSMVHLKQANDRCETYLSTVSEPLNAFCEMNGDRLKAYLRDDYSLAPRGTYLDTAWKTLIQNHPHDSICGCSIGDVHRDNEYRFRQAEQMAKISAIDCVNVIARNMRCKGEHEEAVLLYNPSQCPVDGVCTFEMQIRYHGSKNRRFYDCNDQPLEVQILSETMEMHPNERLLRLIRFDEVAKLSVAAKLSIPAFGYTVIYCDHLKDVFLEQEKDFCFRVFNPPYRLSGGQMTAHHCVDNGALIVSLNNRGLLDVTDKHTGRVYENLHLLEDRSDIGEGWNWIPATYDHTIYGDQALSQFGVLSDGPLCTVWKMVYTLRLPKKAAGGRRSDWEEEQIVTTILTIPRDSSVLYFQTEIQNETENHRLRVLFPTYLPEETFYTKTPFDLTAWEVKAEDNTFHKEAETGVHPSQGITRIGEVALYTKGLYEVEVTDDEEKALALTLFRASEAETANVYAKEIKMQRELKFEYAMSFTTQSKTETMLEGEAYRASIIDFPMEQNPKADVLDGKGSFLNVSECQKIVSHISERDGSFYLRLYDVSGVEETVTVTFPKEVVSVEYVNLEGRPLRSGESCGKQVKIYCPAHKIVTVKVSLK